MSCGPSVACCGRAGECAPVSVATRARRRPMTKREPPKLGQECLERVNARYKIEFRARETPDTPAFDCDRDGRAGARENRVCAERALACAVHSSVVALRGVRRAARGGCGGGRGAPSLGRCSLSRCKMAHELYAGICADRKAPRAHHRWLHLGGKCRPPAHTARRVFREQPRAKSKPGHRRTPPSTTALTRGGARAPQRTGTQRGSRHTRRDSSS